MSGETNTIELKPLEEEVRAAEIRKRMVVVPSAGELANIASRAHTSRDIGSMGVDAEHTLSDTKVDPEVITGIVETSNLTTKIEPTARTQEDFKHKPVETKPMAATQDTTSEETNKHKSSKAVDTAVERETSVVQHYELPSSESKAATARPNDPLEQKALQEIDEEPTTEPEVVRSYDLETIGPEEELVRNVAQLAKDARIQATETVQRVRKDNAAAQVRKEETRAVRVAADEIAQKAVTDAKELVDRLARPASEMTVFLKGVE